MAQKLAVALVALFGFANAGILGGEAPNLAQYNVIDQRPQASHVRTVVVHPQGIVVPQGKVVVVSKQRRGERESEETSSCSSEDNAKKGGVDVNHVEIVQTVRHHSHRQEHQHHHHHQQAKIQVPDVSFNKLKYNDDTKGQNYKAPLTIVTVPRVHSIVDEEHHVAVNERIGKSNCPECVKDSKEGQKVERKGYKRLVRYDEKLQTEIEAPIKKTLVKQNKVEEGEHRQTNYDKFDHLHRHDYVAVQKVVVAQPVVHQVKVVRTEREEESCSSDNERDGTHRHSAKTVVVPTQTHSTVLVVGAPARRVVAEKVVVGLQGQDPRGEETIHEHHGSESHRHNNDDNIDRSKLPGQLARGEIRQNTVLSVGVLKLEGKQSYHGDHHENDHDSSDHGDHHGDHHGDAHRNHH